MGFRVEGTLREAVYKGGKYVDVVMMGCLRSDYEALVEQNGYWKDGGA